MRDFCGPCGHLGSLGHSEFTGRCTIKGCPCTNGDYIRWINREALLQDLNALSHRMKKLLSKKQKAELLTLVERIADKTGVKP